MKIEALRPLHIRRATGDLHLRPGLVVDLADDDAIRLIAKAPGAVRPVVQPGDLVEWLSPALPRQQGEVLAVYPDGTFEVFVPISEVVRRLPIQWVTRVLNAPMSTSQERPIS